jgi:hypothetical protein
MHELAAYSLGMAAKRAFVMTSAALASVIVLAGGVYVVGVWGSDEATGSPVRFVVPDNSRVPCCRSRTCGPDEQSLRSSFWLRDAYLGAESLA